MPRPAAPPAAGLSAAATPAVARVAELLAMLSAALPADGAAYAPTRRELARASAELERAGAAPLPASLGLDWSAAGAAELVGAPATPAAVDALRAAAREYGRAAASSIAALGAGARRAAIELASITDAVRVAALAVTGAALAVPPVLSRALLAWAGMAQAAVAQLGGALSLGAGIGSGLGWLVLGALAFLYFTRRN